MGFRRSVFFLAFLASLCDQVLAEQPSVRLQGSEVRGVAAQVVGAGVSVHQYLGIPYAITPPERFSPPRAIRQQTWVVNADTLKPACMQQFNYPESSRNFALQVFNNPAPPGESEDCLYLNVYTPTTPAPAGGWPVMFWLYGGSLQFGTGSLPGYNGSAFAAYENIVLVTINYRTNVFGFPGSPELPDNGHNLGFLDQRTALDWVQRNIKAFGGDPEKVTVFGESAGAFSTDALLTSFGKDQKPPFRAAILQSGQYSYRSAPRNISTNFANWDKLASALNCTSNSNSTLACVKAAPATTIKDIIERGALVFSPMPDNITLFPNPAAKRLSGDIYPIPVMSGSNAQEGRVFAQGMTNVSAALLTSFPVATAEQRQAIADAYPVGQDGLDTPFDAIAQIMTENRFQCSQAQFANDTASMGIPSYRYYFNASFPNLEKFPAAGVYHSIEIDLVFRNYESANVTSQEVFLSDFLQSTWASFARNPAAGPGWSALGKAVEGGKDLAVIGPEGVRMGRQEEVDGRCGLFDGLYNLSV
ncbi:alpha/beta-hydrolase [Aulographum hederae CBS 113979]|uniref:Carboxylic ester hydrolase n=1 Tax=Aulographum hederae CBS 113979 TaxID=1176131 RepID=A0A6G1HC25_9PEZI|nr:alpha/beta-hydrolase [Aulographum hederae CBS 113979]